MERGALAGIVVLDLTRALSGPFCTMVLGDLGAEVIKVELPGTGDEARHWGAPFAETCGAAFIGFNRNKRSVEIDLHTEAGQRQLIDLAAQADVLVENFRPGTMRRFGVDEPVLKARNPGLIYCSISGYGQHGPLAQQGAMDLVIQAISGVMSLNGEPDGRPMKAAVPIADLLGGFGAAFAIVAALLGSERGTLRANRAIDISMLDMLITMLGQPIVAHQMSGQEPKRYGNAHETIAPYTSFRTATRDIVMSLANDKRWRQLCSIAGFAALALDPRYATQPLRNRHRDALYVDLEAILVSRSAEHWLDAMLALGLPAAPVNSVPEILAHPHLAERGTLLEVEYPPQSGRRVAVPGMPWRDVASLGPVLDPPSLGQHTDEIFARYGIARAETDAPESKHPAEPAGSVRPTILSN